MGVLGEKSTGKIAENYSPLGAKVKPVNLKKVYSSAFSA
jgi:hypothetical protein